MELNYDYDLWQFKNMVEGREELDLDWIGKVFETYFKGYWEQEDRIFELEEEIDSISEEQTLEDQMFRLDSNLRKRLIAYNKIRTEKGFTYSSTPPFLSNNFKFIDLTECVICNSGDESANITKLPKVILGCESEFDKNLKEFMNEKVEERDKLAKIKQKEKRVKELEIEEKEKAEYERLKSKYEKV